jgi:hypothetical protein
VDLLLFCGAFLLHASVKKENWQALAVDVAAMSNETGNFLRRYPGVTPFVRRFNELLVHSAVLLYHHSEQPQEKRRHMISIARLLERMRFSQETPASEQSTVIYFFLPSNETETSFGMIYPQDGREGTFYSLPLTRTMVKQGGPFPPLDEKLREQIKSESKRRISWEDTASWSRSEDAMTEANYPYSDVLPMR